MKPFQQLLKMTASNILSLKLDLKLILSPRQNNPAQSETVILQFNEGPIILQNPVSTVTQLLLKIRDDHVTVIGAHHKE